MKSENIAELACALSKAQSEMKPASKDASNPFFKSKYATLESVWEACRGPLTKNGLSIAQLVDGNALQTILMHSSGQWIDSSYPLNPVKNDPQGMGSAISYSRRYSLMAIVGIAAEDDDGNAASKLPHIPTEQITPHTVGQGFTVHPEPGSQAILPTPKWTPPKEPLILPDAGKYIIQIGKKYAGRSIENVYFGDGRDDGPQGLKSYIAFLEEQAEKKSTKITGKTAEMIAHVERFLGFIENTPPATEQDIPF